VQRQRAEDDRRQRRARPAAPRRQRGLLLQHEHAGDEGGQRGREHFRRVSRAAARQPRQRGAGIAAVQPRHLGQRQVAQLRHHLRHGRQVAGFVAQLGPVPAPPLRRDVGRIGLEHPGVVGQCCSQLADAQRAVVGHRTAEAQLQAAGDHAQRLVDRCR
jgi:hypothetical protein